LIIKSISWYPLTNLISCYAFMCAYVQKRRDRINKKMRALQDLIPNSNKVGTIFIRNLINIYVLFHNLFLNFFFFFGFALLPVVVRWIKLLCLVRQ
jgi:hypothetical protein